MIIKEIYIDGFGIFHEYQLKNLGKGVNIIEGENEAGKSTLLNFIRYTLFGYPNKNSERHEPVDNSSGHGGRIIAQFDDGKEVVFERQAGTKGGKIQLHSDGNISADPIKWYAHLGNANLQLFQNIYGFTLNELIGFDTLQNSGIEDKIFSLGIGVTNVSVRGIEDSITTKAENIYKKGGSKQDIPLLLKSIEEKKNNIAIIQNGLQQYESIITRIGNIQGLVNDLANNIQKETSAKELLTNYLKCYDSYISVLQIERELKNGPSEFFCPVDGEQQLNNLEIQAETFGNAIEQLRSNESNDGIDQINLSIAAIQINDDIPSNEELIVTLNEQLEKYQITITENLNTQREIANLDKAILENLSKINSAWTEATIKNFSDLISHKDAIQQFGTKFEQFKQDRISIVARQQAQHEQSNDGNKNINYLFGILIPALLSIPAFLYSIAFGTTFLVIALLVLLVFLMSKKTTTPGNNSELADIDENIKKVTDDYRQYLQKQLNLEPNLSVTAVVEIFSLIDTSKQAIAKREEYHRIYEERNEYVKQFENLATDLKNKKLFQSASDSFEVFARDAKRQLAIEKQNLNTKARLTNILDTKVTELKRQQQKLRDLQNKINGLFQDAGAPDRNGFLQKCRSAAKARELLEQKQINTNTIEKIIGFGKTDQLFSFFSDKDRTQVESEIKQLQAVIDDKKTAQLQLTNEKGGLETELKTLASASVLSELQTELEVDRNKLFDCYKQWLKHKIAFNVLNTIKRQYELEKQPEVVRYSSEVFSAITSSKYKRIHAPLDSREVLIYDQHERVKKIDQLSRGTKEQLLLSLRLGLIQEYEKNKEPLPIVLDDVFVNFDSCRTKNIAEAIQKFAENRQVIIFTCHSNLANNFPASANKVNLLPYHVESKGISNELLSRDIPVN